MKFPAWFAGVLLGLLGLLGPLGQAAGAQESEDSAQRFFALPMTRDTRELAAATEEHLQAERYPEALAVLQRILEEHAQEVLPAERARPGAKSTYPGAAEWALERMFALPERARAEYCARYEPRAAEALARACLAPERSNLVVIPRAWPIVPSAVRAWWALGDLELESGQLEAAELAWRRALALAQQLGLALEPAPSAARLEWLEARAATPRPTRAALRPSLPRGDAEPWTRELDMTPFVQRGGAQIGHNLQPFSTGEKVLVCTTLRLYALDAYNGELLWQAGPPRGWSALAGQDAESRLFEGINYRQLVLRPAVGDGVALAVLQEPFTENENEQWQGITIMTAIPERRLHAFDLESGRELWNHAPPLEFDGLRQRWDGGGSYAQRMMVAGTPTVAGARVLVPCYRMQGRIDYHVACYELESGTLLWSTLVISGQRERNMFGRSVFEFSASSLVVEGDRVLAQTELGTLAALDLFSGRLQWQTTYKQIALPRTKSYQPPKRDLTWELAPPVIVGDVLVATPSDSPEIVALRLADGARLWAYTEKQLQDLERPSGGFNVLLGADQDVLYLSGAKVSALQKPGGLASTAFFDALWTKPLERPDTSPRALLTADAILCPSPLGRVVYDRRTGEPIPSLGGGWKGGEAGYLWAGEGALFSLSSQGLAGYFDWQAQLERARKQAHAAAGEEDLDAAAELFLRRGKLFLEEGALENARTTLQEARELFARAREKNARRDGRGELVCARALAEALARSKREEEALAVLAGVRTLAENPAELAALLFQEERILRARGGAVRIRVLDEIEASWGAHALPADERVQAARNWLAKAAGGETLEPEPSAFRTALWAALERAGERERAGELAAALADLHAALTHAEGALLARGFPAENVVRERIAGLLLLPGGRAAYAPLEEHAAALLAQARAHTDEGGLALVAERFPHSRAAGEALTLLVQRAASAHDARAVAALVSAALARGTADGERESELLLVLARALGEQGNLAFERALVSALARVDPGRVLPTHSGLPAHAGLTLRALAAELAREVSEPTPAPVRFDADVLSSGMQRAGTTEFLGVLRPQGQASESAPLELHIYATRGELQAYSSAAPGQPLWRRPIEEGGARCAFAPGCLIVGTQTGLVCLDERAEERWTRTIADDPPRALAETDGVLVARLRSGTVLACDALLGLPLWEKTLGRSGNWTGPVLGDGHAVFFSELHALPPRALVLDLFHGRVTADIRLTGLDSRSALEDSAWIASERLITPSFQLRPAQLAAFELDGGRRAWTYPFGPEEELHGIAHSEGRAFPVTYAAALGNAAGNGGVYELDDATGAVRRVVPLRPGERVMGLDARARVELGAPYLFSFTHSEAERSVPIRAIQLPYGIQWTWTLPIAAQELYDGRALPMPAVSADCVAIAYPMRRANGQGAETTIVFLDKRAGKKVDTRILGGAFAQVGQLELRGLGAALFVLGKSSTPRGGCLEILEKPR